MVPSKGMLIEEYPHYKSGMYQGGDAWNTPRKKHTTSLGGREQ